MNWHDVFATRMQHMKASEIRDLLKLLDQPEIISFAGGLPDPAFFPAVAFRNAMNDALDEQQAGKALQYSVSEGYGPLRDWICRQMNQLGVPAARENVLITSGSQQALDYLGKVFLSPQDTALVSWPTYLGALGAFNAYEARFARFQPGHNQSPAAYAKDAAEAGGRVKFAYVCPEFANPTGETLDRAAREEILDLSEALDFAVIEDNAYQALRYDGTPEPSILALETQRRGSLEACRTLYCGSFSKTLAPGLRVGWVCGAAEVIAQLVLIKQASDLHSPTLNQMAIHQVAEHVFEAHIPALCDSYGNRRDTMLTALAVSMPDGVSWTRPEGGMFIWVTLPKELNATELLGTALKEHKVAFVPGQAFFADGTNPNTLRLSFSLARDAEIEKGIGRLGNAIRAALQ
ncbi:MAG: PLP-dependent aminotransferase family protein [Pseudomonadota bacterium]